MVDVARDAKPDELKGRKQCRKRQNDSIYIVAGVSVMCRDRQQLHDWFGLNRYELC